MKCYLFALQRQCQIDKYFHHLAISDGLLRLIRHHWIIKENNAEGFKTNCCGKQRCTICDRWNKSRPFLMYMMFTITKWSCEDLLREKAILEPVLTFFSLSLLFLLLSSWRSMLHCLCMMYMSTSSIWKLCVLLFNRMNAWLPSVLE